MKIYNVAKSGWDGIEYQSPNYSTREEAEKYFKKALVMERAIEARRDEDEDSIFNDKFVKFEEWGYSNGTYSLRLYEEDVIDTFDDSDLQDWED